MYINYLQVLVNQVYLQLTATRKRTGKQAQFIWS